MHEPAAPTPVQSTVAFARLSAAVDALSSAIAGFALHAGARAFMFIALLGWREPVLGGAGLVLLALVGWLRWQCGGTAAVVRRLRPRCSEVRDVACYNRPSQCDATRSIAVVERQSFGHVRTRV